MHITIIYGIRYKATLFFLLMFKTYLYETLFTQELPFSRYVSYIEILNILVYKFLENKLIMTYYLNCLNLVK